jgi:hypothetical protein
MVLYVVGFFSPLSLLQPGSSVKDKATALVLNHRPKHAPK